MANAEALQQLLDKEACRALVLRFARGIDRRDEAVLRDIFHPDGTDDHGYFKGSASEFIAWVLPVLATMERTQHCVSNILVDVNGDEAVSEAYFVAWHDLVAPDGKEIRMTAAGRYLDHFRKHDGEWKIFHRKAVFDWNANEPRTDNWDRSADTNRLLGKAGSGDSLYAMLDRIGAKA